MKLFVDTGSIKDIETLAALGILDGVTTNPSLLAKEPGDFHQNLKRICDIVQGPVSGEVTATDFAGMITQGHEIAKIDQHMVVKVPLTRDGIRACKALAGEGIRVNVTLCFSAAQALLAAKAGASYISPFVGRLDDIATNGMELIREINLLGTSGGDAPDVSELARAIYRELKAAGVFLRVGVEFLLCHARDRRHRGADHRSDRTTDRLAADAAEFCRPASL